MMGGVISDSGPRGGVCQALRGREMSIAFAEVVVAMDHADRHARDTGEQEDGSSGAMQMAMQRFERTIFFNDLPETSRESKGPGEWGAGVKPDSEVVQFVSEMRPMRGLREDIERKPLPVHAAHDLHQ